MGAHGCCTLLLSVKKSAFRCINLLLIAVAASRFKKWLDEIRLHTVDPQKLRIKADSLLNEAQAVDLGFSAEDLLVATLIAGKFGANVKKTPAVRTATHSLQF